MVIGAQGPGEHFKSLSNNKKKKKKYATICLTCLVQVCAYVRVCAMCMCVYLRVSERVGSIVSLYIIYNCKIVNIFNYNA